MDFSDITIDPYERPWAAMVDACTGGCKGGGPCWDLGGFVGTWESGSSLLTGRALAGGNRDRR